MSKGWILIFTNTFSVGALLLLSLAYAEEKIDPKKPHLIWRAEDYPTVLQKGKGDFREKGSLTNKKEHQWRYMEPSLKVLPQPVEVPQFKDFISSDNKEEANTQFRIGLDYFLSALDTNTPENFEKAVYWFHKAAELGNKAAQSVLGTMYSKGLGVPKDLKKALFWHKKAAEQGHAGSQLNLGVMYADGVGIPENHNKAEYWILRSAQQGNKRAQYAIGKMYSTGLLDIKDHNKAAYWLRKAAEQGVVMAQCELGWMYATGEGVPRDGDKALYWSHKAAEQGYVKAQSNLGYMYFNGLSIPQHHKTAAYWYKKAAEQGDVFSQMQLGDMYYTGNGVDKNYIFAYVLFNIASTLAKTKLELLEAREKRELVLKKMTNAQISKAQDLSLGWKPGQPLPLP